MSKLRQRTTATPQNTTHALPGAEGANLSKKRDEEWKLILKHFVGDSVRPPTIVKVRHPSYSSSSTRESSCVETRGPSSRRFGPRAQSQSLRGNCHSGHW